MTNTINYRDKKSKVKKIFMPFLLHKFQYSKRFDLYHLIPQLQSLQYVGSIKKFSEFSNNNKRKISKKLFNQSYISHKCLNIYNY